MSRAARIAALLLALLLPHGAAAQAPDLDPLRARARESIADMQLGVAVAFAVYREMAQALLDVFAIVPDLPRESAADQLMIHLMLPEDRNDPRFAVLGLAVQTWVAAEARAGAAAAPLPYWGARGFDRARLVAAACIMWGRGLAVYRTPAERAGVPAEMAAPCRSRYEEAQARWDRLLDAAFAADDAMRPGRGVVSVVWETGDEQRAVRALREGGMLEQVAAQITAAFELPADLTIRIDGCADPILEWQHAARTIRLCSGVIDGFDALIRPPG